MSIYRGRTSKEIYLASLLYDAIDDKDFLSAKTYLSTKSADPNLILPNKGISPFHLTIGIGSEDQALAFAGLLLQHGADPNIKSDDGLTPLHIAAAFGRCRVLKLLLYCGGDPEIKDLMRQKPLDYARDYDHMDCVEVLKNFAEDVYSIMNRNQDTPEYNLSLEKILVNGAHTDNDYEVVHEYATQPLTKENLESLQNLPKSNATEYVMNWCQNQMETVTKTEAVVKPELGVDSDFIESSVDESDGGKSVPLIMNSDRITFRKVYRKKRSPSKAKSTRSSTAETSRRNSSILENLTDREKKVNEPFGTKPSSVESGINSLPNSLKNNPFEIPVLKLNDLAISIKDEPLVKQETSFHTDTASSDYKTCKSENNSDINILNESKDVFFRDEKKSVECQDQNFLCNIRKTSIVSNKSDGVISSSEASFVSVSEVYKYIDQKEGVVLYEKRLLKAQTSDYAGSIKSSTFSSKLSSIPPKSEDYDTDVLRKELTAQGYNPGPITFTTKRVYLRKLKQLKQNSTQLPVVDNSRKIFSVELEKTLKDPNYFKDVTSLKSLEEIVAKEFVNPNPSRKWREGTNKCSFTYFLLDPRVTNNLPCRAELMELKDIWEIFLSSIFYVGKGKRMRPYSHLYESLKFWKRNERTSSNKKVNKILDIWSENSGVICLHVFQSVIPVEAYTREAAILSALKLENLCNIKSGEYYGIASTWPQKQKKLLGVYLLYKAMMIFLNEGERQLCPEDIE